MPVILDCFNTSSDHQERPKETQDCSSQTSCSKTASRPQNLTMNITHTPAEGPLMIFQQFCVFTVCRSSSACLMRAMQHLSFDILDVMDIQGRRTASNTLPEHSWSQMNLIICRTKAFVMQFMRNVNQHTCYKRYFWKYLGAGLLSDLCRQQNANIFIWITFNI